MVSRSRARRGTAVIRVLPAVAVAAGIVAAAGCSSSKPAYCTDRTTLQNSVKDLTSSISSRDFSNLKSQAGTVQTDATALASSAKSDFPDQTSAITSSVGTLKTAVQALPQSPSAADIATVAQPAAGVVSSVNTFMNASNSKCS